MLLQSCYTTGYWKVKVVKANSCLYMYLRKALHVNQVVNDLVFL